MTALTEFQRLECTGLWREAPEAQKREVIVSFGDATLVLSEPRSQRALTHWSLPAILRLNPGDEPARYAPAADADEELEIEDATMVAAIDKVHTLISARKPHPGRLRGWLMWSGLVAVLAVGVLWLPRAIIDHTAEALPFATRQTLGRLALEDLERLTGAPCASVEGTAALTRLRDRMTGTGGETHVLPAPLKRPQMLPGGVLVLPTALIDGQDRPEVPAAAILAAQLAAEDTGPTRALLRHAGLRATIGLITTGSLSPEAVKGYGDVILAGDDRLPRPERLLQRFAEAGISSTPFAYAIDPTGETTLALIEADPHAGDARPVMTDTDWVALQGICDG